MQRLDFHKLYDLKRLMFMKQLSHLDHDITAGLLPWYFTLTDIHELQFIYDITMTSRSSDIKKVYSICSKYMWTTVD